MAKGRSPQYPSMSLGDAIGRVRKIYEAEHTHTAEREVIAKDLGYGGLNGASLTVIAALNRYGLLEADKDNEGLRVSGSTVSILELPEGEPRRVEAIEKAAFAPQLFAELRDNFRDQLPSDHNLRNYLVKKGFLPKAADSAIRVYRDTLELVSRGKSYYNSETDIEGGSESVIPEPVPSPPLRKEVPASYMLVQNEPQGQRDMEFESGESLVFRISKGSRARIAFSGPITQEAIGKLNALLELTKDDYPTQAELNAAMRPVLDTPDDPPSDPVRQSVEEEQ